MTLVDADRVLREEDVSSADNAWAASWNFGAGDRGLPSDMAQVMADYI